MPSMRVPVTSRVETHVVIDNAQNRADAIKKARAHWLHHYDDCAEATYVEGVYERGSAVFDTKNVKDNGTFSKTTDMSKPGE